MTGFFLVLFSIWPELVFKGKLEGTGFEQTLTMLQNQRASPRTGLMCEWPWSSWGEMGSRFGGRTVVDRCFHWGHVTV